MRRLTAVAVLLIVATCVAAQSPSLTEKSYARWRDFILPTADELRWTRIPWRTSLRDGVLEANEAGKPVLLWTMNGHPLGCT